MRLEAISLATLLCLSGCAPGGLWEGNVPVLSSEEGHVALACDVDRAVLIEPTGYTLVTEGPQGLVTQAVVTGAPEMTGGQGSARLVGDRLLVANGSLLNIFDVSKAPELVRGTVPLDVRAAFELVGHTLYLGRSAQTVEVYDVTDVTAPKLLRTVQSSDTNPYFLRAYRDHLYMVGASRKSLQIFSLQDPQKPVLVNDGAALDFGAIATYQVGNLLPVGDHLVLTSLNQGRFATMQPFAVDIHDPPNAVVTQKLTPMDAACTMIPLAYDGDRSVLGIEAGHTYDIIRPNLNPPAQMKAIDVTHPEAPVYTCNETSFGDFAGGATVDVCVLGKSVLFLGRPRSIIEGTTAWWLNVARR